MHGLRLERLLSSYARLRATEGLDLLCLQEDTPGSDGALCSTRIARHLGPGYSTLAEPACPGLAVVYDRRRLEPVDLEIVPLPLLRSLSWFEKLYIVGGKPQQKHALVARFRTDGAPPMTVVTFHLDTAGGNAHRARQVRALAEAVRARGWHERLTACGDTNAFSWTNQLDTLQALLAPLRALGAVDPGREATHWFARQNEPRLTHRTSVLIGKLGIDVPHRYDVVCSNLPAPARGQLTTHDSDHDLVWARLDMRAPAAAQVQAEAEAEAGAGAPAAAAGGSPR